MIDTQNAQGFTTIEITNPELIGAVVSPLLPLKFSSFNLLILQGFDGDGDFEALEYADVMIDGVVSVITEQDESIAVNRSENFNPLYLPTTSLKTFQKCLIPNENENFSFVSGVSHSLTPDGEEGVKDTVDSYTLKSTIVRVDSEQLTGKMLVTTYMHDLELPAYGEVLKHFSNNTTLNTIN